MIISYYSTNARRDIIMNAIPRRSHVPAARTKQLAANGKKIEVENGESDTVICRIGTQIEGAVPKYNCVYYENGESLDGTGTPAILYALEIAGDVVLEGMYVIAHIIAVQRTGEDQ